MPGIVGIITKRPRAWAAPQLQRMIESMQNEPFYVTASFIDESSGVFVGCVVRKNSFAEAMPVVNERGDVTLLFSGEEFPDPSLRRQLRERGHDVHTDGPDYLVHLYEDEDNFPASLNGRFQGIVTDRSRSCVTLFNDRYGMHKLYFHETADAFYFSAEAKAILKVRPELRKLDLEGMADMVTAGCVTEGRTIFEGIRTFPPGAKWTFKQGTLVEKARYFDPREWEEQDRATPDSFYSELRDTFQQRLGRFFEGPERIGLALTGGLDTRIIMAWLRVPQNSLPCYTFGGMYRDCQDVIMARQVARLCRQQHEVIHVGDEFLSRFPHYAERSVYLTDASVTVRSAPDLYVQEIARQIAPVRISGTYGSEVLRGIAALKVTEPCPGLWHSDVLPQLQLSRERFRILKKSQTHPVSLVAFHETPMRAVDTLEQTQLAVRSPYLDNAVMRMAFRAPDARAARSDIFANHDICNRLIGDGNRDLRGIRTDRGLAATGLAAAFVRNFLEFTFYAEYAYDYGMPQWLAKIDHLFSPLHFERLFIGRHKFAHFRLWYRGALSGYVRDVLLDSRTLSRPYLNRKVVEAIVSRHLKGDQNFTVPIHQLLTLELTQRLLVEQT
jgi:asparagine synthase (glutamine-hydrolysing)